MMTIATANLLYITGWYKRKDLRFHL